MFSPLPQKARESLFLLAFVTVVLAIFFLPALDGQSIIYSGDFSGSDLLNLNLPRRFLAAQAVQHGELPHWTSAIGNGLPLLAEGQSGIFYPTTLPLFLTLPLPWAANLSILLTLAIALTGAYVWARLHGAQPRAALISALAYGLGAAFIFRLKHLNLIQVIAWLPWSLAIIDQLVAQPRALWSALLASCWTLQLLAGHPHATYVCVVSGALYAIILALTNTATRQTPHAKSANNANSTSPQYATPPRPPYLQASLWFAAAGIWALLLAALQLLPTYELVGLSVRSTTLSWAQVNAFPFHLSHAARALYPFIDGNPAYGTFSTDFASNGVFWECTPYIGIIPLALAATALFLCPKQRILAPALAALVTFLLALGSQGGLYYIPYRLLPGFDLFRFPARFLIPSLCFAALLAGLGAQALYERLPLRWKPSIIFLLALTLVDLGIVNYNYQAYLPARCFAAPAAASTLGPTPGRISSPLADETWQALIYSHGWKGNESLILHHLNTLSPDSSAFAGLNQHSDHVLKEGGLELQPYSLIQKCCAQNTRLVSIPHASSHSPLDGKAIALGPEALTLLSRQNVTHIVSLLPIITAGSDLPLSQTLSSACPIYIYTNRQALPYCRLAPKLLPTPASPAESLDALCSFTRLPETTTLVDLGWKHDSPTTLPSPITPASAAPQQGTATLRSRTANSITITTRTNASSNLVVAENWYPSWEASIDGSEARVYPADFAFMAVPVPAGTHEVTLRFGPKTFHRGLYVSLIGVLLLLATVLGEIRQLHLLQSTR